MAAVRTPRASAAATALAIVAVLVDHADLPGADLLDRLDRVQAAQPGDDGAADGVLHSPRSRRSSSCSPSACSCCGRSTRRPTPRRRGGRSAIYDGGERVLKVGGDSRSSRPIPSRFLNSLIVAIIQHLPRRGDGHDHRLRLLALPACRARPDLLFFILSTRMLPPVVVAIPMFLMYRAVGLVDTHLGLIILYTAFNLSFSVWLMKGFIDEIPKEYEEAALVDGYTRMQAFFKIVLPRGGDRHRGDRRVLLHHRLERVRLRADHDQPPRADGAALHPVAARLGPAPTGRRSRPAPCLFLLPVALFTFLLRNHLLRGVTFGAIRK